VDPFDRAWKRYVTSVVSDFEAMAKVLVEGYHFDPGIRDMLLDDWVRRDRLSRPDTAEAVDVMISVSAHGRRIFAADATERRRLVDGAARQSFAMLLEATLLAEWCPEQREVVAASARERLFILAVRIAGGAAPFPAGSAVSGAAEEWLRQPPWTSRGYDKAFRVRLQEWMTNHV
jgi:hypothetical protein